MVAIARHFGPSGRMRTGVTVAWWGGCEVLQVYLYGEAITDRDAFIAVIEEEEANGAELVDITLTSLLTSGNQHPGSSCGEAVAVLTFRCA